MSQRKNWDRAKNTTRALSSLGLNCPPSSLEILAACELKPCVHPKNRTSGKALEQEVHVTVNSMMDKSKVKKNLTSPQILSIWSGNFSFFLNLVASPKLQAALWPFLGLDFNFVSK